MDFFFPDYHHVLDCDGCSGEQVESYPRRIQDQERDRLHMRGDGWHIRLEILYWQNTADRELIKHSAFFTKAATGV